MFLHTENVYISQARGMFSASIWRVWCHFTEILEAVKLWHRQRITSPVISGSNRIKFVMATASVNYADVFFMCYIVPSLFPQQFPGSLCLNHDPSHNHYTWTFHCSMAENSISFQLNATNRVINLIFFCLRITSYHTLKYLTWVPRSIIKHSSVGNGE